MRGLLKEERKGAEKGAERVPGTRVRRQKEEEREMRGGKDPPFKTSTTIAMVTREVRKEMRLSQNSQRCLRFYQQRWLSG